MGLINKIKSLFIKNRMALLEVVDNYSIAGRSEKMSATKREMKNEAIRRMASIRMNKEIIDDFKETGNPQVYEPPYGAGYYLEEDEEDVFKKMEKRFNILIWGVIRCYMKYNRKDVVVDCALSVSNNKNDWETERKDLLAMTPFVYTYMADYSIRDHGYINIYLTEGGTP